VITIALLGAKSQSAPLDSVPAELSQLKQQFNDSTLSFTLEYEPYLTRDLLGKLLNQHANQIDFLHFAGHSSAQQLETNDETVYSHHIADVFADWSNKPRLVFINGCSSAGQVDDFLDAGIDCVIATYKPIGDKIAAHFAKEFYAVLLSNPTQVTLANAFKRAGSVVLLGEPRKARSLHIEALHTAKKEWDWGLFSRNEGEAAQRTIEPAPPPPLDFIRKKKFEQAQSRWQLLFDRLTIVQAQFDLETRSEEKVRIQAILRQNQNDLDVLESEIQKLQA